MQSKMYQVTILRQFGLSENAVFQGHHPVITDISSNLSGHPCTQFPESRPGHTQDAGHQGYIFRRFKAKLEIRTQNRKPKR